MKRLFTIVLLALAACSNEKREVEENIKKHLLDYAFKENGKMTVHELSLLSINDLSNYQLDSAKHVRYYLDWERLDDEFKQAMQDFEESKDDFKDAAIFGTDNALYKMRLGQMTKAAKKGDELIAQKESVDSILKAFEDRPKDLKPSGIRLAKIYLKATTLKEGHEQNTLDTLGVLIDKENKVYTR